MNQTPTTPIKGPLRWAFVALLLASLAAMYWGREENRPDLQFVGFAALLVLLAWFAIYRKRRAARDPDFAAKMKQITSPTTVIGINRRIARRMMGIMIPALLLAMPLIWMLRQLQPTTPMLTGISEAGIERIAIVAGIVITLAGYGARKLLRRGDSGAG